MLFTSVKLHFLERHDLEKQISSWKLIGYYFNVIGQSHCIPGGRVYVGTNRRQEELGECRWTWALWSLQCNLVICAFWFIISLFYLKTSWISRSTSSHFDFSKKKKKNQEDWCFELEQKFTRECNTAIMGQMASFPVLKLRVIDFDSPLMVYDFVQSE